MYTIFGQNSSPLEFHLKYSLPILRYLLHQSVNDAQFSPRKLNSFENKMNKSNDTLLRMMHAVT